MRLARFIVTAVLLVVTASCGYSLIGRGGGLPKGVEKISVSSFRNTTDQYGLEAEATEAFIQELMRNGSARIVKPGEAEARLEGALLAFDNSPVAYTSRGVIVERRVTITARVEFYVTGNEKPFFSEEKGMGWAEYPVSESLVRDTQGEREAARRALADLAQKVVSRLVEGF
jgi:outer membrane lipopolysaccharide assembly protein LptE/RlpB